MMKFAIVPLALLLGAVGCSTSSSQSGMLKRQEALLARQEALASRLESAAAKLESTPAAPASVEQQELSLLKQIILLQRKLEEGRHSDAAHHPALVEMESKVKGLQDELSALEQAGVEQQALPLRKQISRLQRELDEVRHALRPTHPKVLAMEEQLKGLQHKLSELEPASKAANALEPAPAR